MDGDYSSIGKVRGAACRLGRLVDRHAKAEKASRKRHGSVTKWRDGLSAWRDGVGGARDVFGAGDRRVDSARCDGTLLAPS